MSWWNKIWQSRTESRDALLQRVRLDLPGWHDEGRRGDMRGWRDDEGDFISLVITNEDLGLAELSDEAALQRGFRGLAEAHGGGLIEVRLATGLLGPTASVIYKRRMGQGLAYAFTGMLLAPGAYPPQKWIIVTQERGMTGVREAIITCELLNAGRLTLEEYQRSWAKDPYDAGYEAVDRSVLRFVSDDESYDERFPQHPLTKMRRILTSLPSSVSVLPAREWLLLQLEESSPNCNSSHRWIRWN